MKTVISSVGIERFLARFSGMILALLLIALSLWNPVFLNDLRLKYFDALLRHMPAAMGEVPVVIVDIDSKSLAAQGQWPWPRDLIAELLNRIAESSPAAVGIDVVFAEPDRSSPRQVLTNDDLAEMPPSVLENIRKLPDHDFELAKVLYYSPVPIIIGHVFTNGDGPSEQTVPKSGNFAILGEDPSPFLFHFNQVDANLKMFEKTAQGSGFFNILPDPDGIVRNEPLLIAAHDELYPSLVLSMVQATYKAGTMVVETDRNGVQAVRVGPHRIPTDGAGRFIVNYSGPARTFSYLSAIDILNGTFDPALLEDAYVLVGTSAPGLFDIRAVPTDQVFPAVEIHAHALNTILTGNFLIQPEWAKGAELVYLLIISLILILLLPKLKAAKGALLALLMGGGITIFSLWNFRHNHLLVDMIYPLATTGLLFTFFTFFNYLAEEKKARRIRTIFSQYLSPVLVEELVENQDALALDGDERELTILFSDIRGFTSLAENMSPQNLCTFLNEYLTPMTKAVMDQRGTVDKFIGDAVMAFWNAPLTSPEHVYRACVCAVEMLSILDELNSTWEERGFPAIRIGIGIHCGVARVGNMGSYQRFDYTVMGNVVNLCSRLEELNKIYGTSILVSDAVYTTLTESDFAFRKVDRLRVKGKHEPVTIYQLLGWRAMGEAIDTESQFYDTALTAYEKGDFQTAGEQFLTLKKSHPNDQLYAVYEERCRHLTAEPPENWDGIANIISKLKNSPDRSF